MLIKRRQVISLAAVGLALGMAQTALAQEWPARQPLRIVVPYPAGGNADSAARAIAEVVSANIKQTVIVDNRPGASTIIGTEMVSRAPADGYTLGVVSDSHAINQAMARMPKSAEILGAKVPYDAVRNFVPVAGMIQVPLVLVASPKIQARNVKDLVALSTKAAGINFGSMGMGSPWFIHMHQLNSLLRINFVDVPYKGLQPAAMDLLAGQIDVMVMPVHYAQQHIRAGKLTALATLGVQRHSLLPDVPTLSEAGYPGLNISNYLYFVAPVGTPQPVVDRLSREINAALKLPAVREKMSTSGDPYPAEPAELSARLLRDIDAYGSVIKTTVK